MRGLRVVIETEKASSGHFCKQVFSNRRFAGTGRRSYDDKFFAEAGTKRN
jgi:hypothetical protein